jgi:glycerol-3-phosphate acyltransferase PlsY
VDWLALLLAVGIVVASYFIGGIPWGVVVARLVGGPDPRTLGSGRTGGANVLRALGPKWALASGLLDMLKGTAAVLLARLLGAGPWVEVLAAAAAIVGHSRSPYLRLKGGRGVSVGYGALLVIHPIIAAATIPLFLGIIVVTGYSSLGSLAGSLVAGAALAVVTVASNGPTAYLAYGLAGTALIWLFHLDNIQRLLAGTERKVDWRRRGGPAVVPTPGPGSDPPAPPAASPPV